MDLLKKFKSVAAPSLWKRREDTEGLGFTSCGFWLVFLACAMLFLAGGCGADTEIEGERLPGGPPDGGMPPNGPSETIFCPPAPLTLGLTWRDEDPEEVIRVTVKLEKPSPSGGTSVRVTIEPRGITDPATATVTIAEGETTATTAPIKLTDDQGVIDRGVTIFFSAVSTNPMLNGSCRWHLGPPTPPEPTRPNPIELEFRTRQLGTPNQSDGRDYRTDEFNGHYGLASISADEAYMRGYFGQGVTIAIAEDGIDENHPDLNGRVRDKWHILNRNAVVGETCRGGEVTGGICRAPGAGHGTYVALLAAGTSGNGNPDDIFEITLDGGSSVVRTRNVHGVAPQASITSISMSGGASPREAISYAAETDVQVLNFSIGIGAPFTLFAPVPCNYGKYEGREGIWLTCKDLPFFRPLLVEDLGEHTSRLTGEFADIALTLEGKDIVLVWAAGNDGWNSESDFRVPMCGKNRIKPDERGCPLGELEPTKQDFMENFRWIHDADNPERTVSFREMWGTECGEDNCVEYNSPGGWKEAPRFEPGLLGKWLVVAASGEDGRITQFSNGCGAARNWCIVAPGDNLTVNPPGEEGIDGTSFAAPMVSGALAVLKSRFHDMPMEVVQAILLVSADPVGERVMDSEKPDPVYGWGRLNLGKAIALSEEIRLPYSVSDAVGVTRGTSPEDYRFALVSAFARAQDGSMYRGQCVSPYEIIRRYRSELTASRFWRASL